MAKIGLNLGEKIEIGGKQYRILDDLVDTKSLFGDLTFVSNDGMEVVYEDVRQPDGSIVSVMTDEIRGVNVSVRSSVQGATVSVLIVDQLQGEIEEMGIGFLEEVELEGIVVSYSAIGRDDIYKIFASKITKKAGQQPKQDKKAEQKQDNQQHNHQ